MEQFSENITSIMEMKVVKGTILKTTENELSDDYDLFYWANCVPHYDNKNIIIIGECGFDTRGEKKEFRFDYNIETNIVNFNQHFRMCICTEELYNMYHKRVHYNKRKYADEQILPWIRFPRSKDGIFIPVLIERILGKIPNKIYFNYTF
jgi:Tat protein secretion system quality control protein TatD with DNase activity